jgi:uncharacterized protein YqgV (UPF0045/DUF77 family)
MKLSTKYKVSGLSGKVLTILEPRVKKLLNDYIAYHELKYKKTPSKFDLECTEMNLVFDVLKSFSKYTKSTDTLKSLSSGTSIKGNLEITARIIREGVEYDFRTEAIYAGGYNIQRLHYRYLTKTKLPQYVNPILKEFNEKIKRMNKKERLIVDLIRVENSYKSNQEKVDKFGKFSREEIIEYIKSKKDYEWPTWEVIVERGADKNFEYSEEFFNNYTQESLEQDIVNFKKQEIEWPQMYIKGQLKDIKRIKSQINEL